MQENHDTVVLRWVFKADSASDFLFEEDVEAGRLVQERNDYTLEEAADFIQEFHSSLEDALILVGGEKVVSMSDYTYEA
jgi:hypothetical protein